MKTRMRVGNVYICFAFLYVLLSTKLATQVKMGEIKSMYQFCVYVCSLFLFFAVAKDKKDNFILLCLYISFYVFNYSEVFASEAN